MRCGFRISSSPVALAAALALTVAASAEAEEIPVPSNLQAELLLMIAAHDRNLPARAGGEVRTAVIARAGDEAAKGVEAFRAAAAAKATVAGLPHAVEVIPFTTAHALAELVKARKLAIVYLGPGFTTEEAGAIGQELSGADVLTASAAPALVKKGVVLGFDLVSGRAKLLADLTQAGKQHVAFGPEVLGLMAVSQ